MDALRAIEGLEDKLASVKPGDKNGANRVARPLKIVLLKIKSARKTGHPKYKEAVKRYNALIAGIKAKAAGGPMPNSGLLGLRSDVSDAFRRMGKSSISTMGDPKVVQGWRDLTASFRKRLAAMPDKTSTQWAKVESEIGQIEGTLANGIAAFKKSKAKAAGESEVAKVLDPIGDKYRSNRVPRDLYYPFDLETAKSWAEAVGGMLNGGIDADLKSITAIAKHPNADPKKVQSLSRWLGIDIKRSLNEKVKKASELVDSYVKNGLDTAKFVMDTDVNNDHHVRNRLLGEGSLDRLTKRLKTGLDSVAAARAFDAGLGRKGGPNRDNEQKTIERAIKQMEVLAEKAVGSVRMPKAQSDDKKLLAAAAKVLDENGHKARERMVINFKLKSHDQWRSHSRLSGSSINTTTTRYVWDEFQTTTAEKEKDGYWLYANRFRFYKKGGTTTRIDVWYLSERFKTTRILEENIKK
ncbi:MAG: hypothetical protein V3W41_15050 [Planctomycetota bacterium]